MGISALNRRISALVRELLTLHKADVGLTLQNADYPKLVPIARLGWWPNAEWAKPLPVSVPDGQPMIGITLRDALDSMLPIHLVRVGPAPRVSVQVQTCPFACSLLAQGEGLALVGLFTARQEVARNACTDVHWNRVQTPYLYVLYRLDGLLSVVQKRFLDLVRQVAERALAWVGK